MKSLKALLILNTLWALTVGRALSHPTDNEPDADVKLLFQVPVTGEKGKWMTGVIADYGPGANTAPHTHGTAFAVVYVLSGTIISHVEGEPEKTFETGESWTEAPWAHHLENRNPSKTEHTKLLAIFTTSEDQKDTIFFDKDKDKGKEKQK